MAMHIAPLGDSALLIQLGERIDEETHARVQAAVQALEATPVAAVNEIVPAYASVTLFYSPAQAAAEGAPDDDIPGWLADQVRARLASLPERPKAPAGRHMEIPVCYDEAFAPDLKEVAARAGLTVEEIVRLHSQTEFLVYLIGFAPGFPYMGGLPAGLAMPRRPTPRVRVAPGSVGIVGAQCGIYPIESPGGWNLIGRTPLRLYRPESDPPVLLRAGDRIKFCAITREEFADWREA